MDRNLKVCYFCQAPLKDLQWKEFEGCAHKLLHCVECVLQSFDIECPYCSNPAPKEEIEDWDEFLGNPIFFISLNSFSLNIPLLVYDSKQNEYQGPFLLQPNQNSSNPFIPSFYPAILQVSPSSFIISGGITPEISHSTGTLTNRVRISNEIVDLTILKEQNCYQFYEVIRKKSLKNARYSHSIFKIGEKIILVGGFIDKIGDFSKTSEILDENWESTPGPQLNVARTQFQGFLLASYLYVFGGFSSESKIEKSFERLNINELKNWESINLKNQEKINGWCSSFVFSNSNDEIYIVGGYDGTQKKGKKEKVVRIKGDEVSDSGFTEFGEINGTGTSPEKDFLLFSVQYKFTLETRKHNNFEYLETQGNEIPELGAWKFNSQEKWFLLC
jgi:hypothetical protein